MILGTCEAFFWPGKSGGKYCATDGGAQLRAAKTLQKFITSRIR
jgi:hypothetical protein